MVALPLLVMGVLMMAVELTETRAGCAHQGMGWNVDLASAGVFPALAWPLLV